MNPERMKEIARGAIERNLGDVAEESPDAIYSEAYTIAFDALADAGIDHAEARRVAEESAQPFAQP